MKTLRKIALTLLCLLVISITAYAETAGDVKIVETSNDFLSGYYVVFEMPNGHRYRSDRCHYQTNYDLWKLCSTQDKRKALKVYAFYESSAREQYGPYYSDMCAWNNNETGWTQAKQTLNDRISSRDYGNLYHMFEELTYDSHFEGKNIRDLNGYSQLDEVAAYLELCDNMHGVWYAGNAAYQSLKAVKMAQTSTAVNSISSDLIGFITDRALVPGITPGGLGALMPSIKGEIIGLVDKITGLSDTIVTNATEKKIDAASARQLIDYYWKIIEYDEKIAQSCVSSFLSFKAELDDKWDKAVEAVELYQTGQYEKVQITEKYAADYAMAGINPQTPDGTTQLELERELYTLDEAVGQWNKDNFVGSALSTRTAFRNRLAGILDNAKKYDWPYVYNRVNYSDTQGERIAFNGTDSFYTADGYMSYLEWYETQLIPALEKFDQQLETKIDQLETYIEDYNTMIDTLGNDWINFYERYLGIQLALSAYGVNGKIPSREAYSAQFTQFADDCGIYGKTQYDFGQSIEEILEELKDYRERFKKIRENLKDDCNELTYELRAAAVEYRRLYAQYAQAAASIDPAYENWLATVEATEASYFNKERGYDISPELKALYDNATNRERATLFFDDITQKAEALSRYKAGVEGNKALANQLYIQLSNIVGRYGWDTCALAYAAGSVPDLYAYSDILNRSYYFSLSGRYSFVESSIREFSGNDSMALAADMTLLDLELQKPNYVRMDEDERYSFDRSAENSMYYTSQRRGWEYTESKHKYSKDALFGTYGNATDWYDLYVSWGDSSNSESWTSQAKDYVVVTDLQGPGSMTLQGAGAQLSLFGDFRMDVGDVWDLGAKVTVLPANATEKTLIFDSDNFDVCSIDGDGVVRAVGPGTATVSVRAKDSGWVTDANTGEKIYTPAPLTYTITVGGNTEDTVYEIEGTDIQWYNYGTEANPQLFKAVDKGSGMTEISFAVDFGAQIDSSIVLLYYTAEGKMVKTAIYTPDVNYGFNCFSDTLPNKTGLKIKVIRLPSNGTWIPMDAPDVDTSIPAAE